MHGKGEGGEKEGGGGVTDSPTDRPPDTEPKCPADMTGSEGQGRRRGEGGGLVFVFIVACGESFTFCVTAFKLYIIVRGADASVTGVLRFCSQKKTVGWLFSKTFLRRWGRQGRSRNSKPPNWRTRQFSPLETIRPRFFCPRFIPARHQRKLRPFASRTYTGSAFLRFALNAPLLCCADSFVQ